MVLRILTLAALGVTLALGAALPAQACGYGYGYGYGYGGCAPQYMAPPVHYVQQPIVQPVVVQQPIIQQPVIQPVVVQQPIIQQPVIQPVVVQQPAIVQQPVVVQQPVGSPCGYGGGYGGGYYGGGYYGGGYDGCAPPTPLYIANQGPTYSGYGMTTYPPAYDPYEAEQPYPYVGNYPGYAPGGYVAPGGRVGVRYRGPVRAMPVRYGYRRAVRYR